MTAFNALTLQHQLSCGLTYYFKNWSPLSNGKYYHSLKSPGMVGMMGAGALTKKRGGYTNTKLHGIMAWVGMILAGCGLYVIYQNKENMGKQHFTTLHAKSELVDLTHLTFCNPQTIE